MSRAACLPIGGRPHTSMRIRFLLLIFFLTALHCATASRTPSIAGEREEEEARPGTNEPLERRIEQMNRGASTTGLRVRVDWVRSGAMTTAEVYGNGAGIYDDRIALRLSSSDLSAVVRALVQSRLAAMPSRFGEADSDFMKMQGRVTVDVDRIGKSVIQIDQGPQSEPLAILAAEIITVAERASRGGVTVDDLSDALAKLAAGSIPPETIRLTVQRRDDRPSPTERGWLLRLRGREAVARSFTNGYGPPRRLVLTDAEFAQLAVVLRETNPSTLPENLYAPMYTDFRIDILGRSRDLQARTYSGVSPTTHGARQAAFDALIERLHALAERVIREGTPTTASD
jgi:hypothetical protein